MRPEWALSGHPAEWHAFKECQRPEKAVQSREAQQYKTQNSQFGDLKLLTIKVQSHFGEISQAKMFYCQ